MLLDVRGEVDRLAAEVSRLNAELALADAAACTPATRAAQVALDRRYARFPATSRTDARRAAAEVDAASAAAAAATDATDATDARDATEVSQRRETDTDARDRAEQERVEQHWATARADPERREALAAALDRAGQAHIIPAARYAGHDESGTPDRSSCPTGADDAGAEAADRCDGDAAVRDAAGAVARARAMVAEATAADAADRDAARREELTRWAEHDRAEQDQAEQAEDGAGRDRNAS